MKNLIYTLLVATLFGCTSLPPEYAKAPQKNLIIGRKQKGVKPLIRSVDNGEPIFVKNNTIGNQVWLSPGAHTLSIATSQDSADKELSIDLNVKTNCYYELRIAVVDETPTVLIEEIDISHIKRDLLRDGPSRMPNLN